MSRSWLVVIILSVVFALSAPLSAQGRGKAKGNPHGDQAAADHDRGHDRDDARWERRGDYEYRVFGKNEGIPPGWSKGKKTGWGNCGLPPGQAKKYGCRSYVYGGRQYFYYHDDAGQIIVRRPIVHVGIDVH